DVCSSDLIVGEGNLSGFANRLKPGKVHHCRDWVLFEQTVQQSGIAYIALNENGCAACNLLDGRNDFSLAIAQVIEDQDLVSGLLKHDCSVAADISGAASDENHELTLPILALIHLQILQFRAVLFVMTERVQNDAHRQQQEGHDLQRSGQYSKRDTRYVAHLHPFLEYGGGGDQARDAEDCAQRGEEGQWTVVPQDPHDRGDDPQPVRYGVQF